jgi:hypothetical protein
MAAGVASPESKPALTREFLIAFNFSHCLMTVLAVRSSGAAAIEVVPVRLYRCFPRSAWLLDAEPAPQVKANVPQDVGVE